MCVFVVESLTNRSKSINLRAAMRLIKLVWLVFLCMPLSVVGQFNTNLPPRPLSLQEALHLAIEHNLDIKIARYAPDIAYYNWRGTYGYYDPSLSAAASHGISVTEGGGFDARGDPTRGVDSKFDHMEGGIVGVLPVTGLKYGLSGNFDHVYGTRALFPFDTYQGRVDLTLQQPLLRDFWTDANRTAIKLAKQDLKIAEQDFRFRVQQVVNLTQQAYYELIASRDEIVSRQKALELAERFADETKRRVELGTLPPLDEVQAQSEAATARADLIFARQRSVLAENTLKSLITDNYELWHSYALTPTERLVAVPEDLDLGASWISGLSLRPDLKALEERLERQGIVVKYQRNQVFPQLDLVGTLGRSGIDNKFNTIVITNVTPRPGPDIRDIVVIPGRDANFSDVLDDISRDNNPSYSYGIVFQTPLGWRRERNALKAAKLQRDALQWQFVQLRQSIQTGIDNALTSARANFERAGATRQATAFAQAALDAEMKKMEAGRSTPFQVLQLQRDLTNRRFEEIRALADYNKALAELSFTEGTILDRNKIAIDIR